MAGVQKSYNQLNGLKNSKTHMTVLAVYNDAMRLDYEATTLTQVVDATGKSVNFAKIQVMHCKHLKTTRKF